MHEIRYPPDTVQPRHHHEWTSATLVFGGSLEERAGGATEHASPLSVVFKPAGTEHTNRVGPAGACTLQIVFDPDFLGRSGGGEPEPAAWNWTHGGRPARRFLELLALWRPRRSGAPSPEAGADRLEADICDLLAYLWDPEKEDDGGDRTFPAGAPGWLARAVEEVEDTFAHPRLVRELAADAAVHPVSLARAHRRHYGFSVSDRIRRRRVQEAARLLGRDGGELSGVAYRTGFSDQSHLTRVFKTETGLTPGRFRELVAG